MKKALLLIVIFLTSLTNAFANATPFIEGPYEKGCAFYNEKRWAEAAAEFRIVLSNYPNAGCAENARFFLGISYFNMGDFDLANKAFSKYLKKTDAPEYFDEVFRYKFLIAEEFRKGYREHLFGSHVMPRCFSCDDEAVALYDEIATTLPTDELAAWAIYRKGCLYIGKKSYKEAIDAFQTAIRRFPNHQLAAASYMGVSYCYLQESKCEANSPDLLCHAMINLKKFRIDFPGDPRIHIVEKQFCEIEELYAQGVFEMGEFYERTEHLSAAMIYYETTIREFPDTCYAKLAKEKIEKCSYELTH